MSFIPLEMRKTPERLDVREIVPRERHLLIFDAFAQLAPGQSFELINDHDPKPLYYQFQAEQPGQLRWEYLEQGPEVWRVRIGRMLDLASTPVLELITSYPALKPVLDGFGLDTCCGAHLTVTESAAEEGIDPSTVIDALRAAL